MKKVFTTPSVKAFEKFINREDIAILDFNINGVECKEEFCGVVFYEALVEEPGYAVEDETEHYIVDEPVDEIERYLGKYEFLSLDNNKYVNKTNEHISRIVSKLNELVDEVNKLKNNK